MIGKDLLKNYYYILGLAIQKGLPYLLIPLIIWKFSLNTFSNFVVVFSIVQMLSLIMALGTPNAFIIFWHDLSNKSHYLSLLLGIVFLISGMVLLPCYFCITHFLAYKCSSALLILIIIYALVMNLNMVGVNLLRALEFSRDFFYGVTFAAIIQILLIIIVPIHNPLLELVGIYVFCLTLQTFLFFKKGKLNVTVKIDLISVIPMTKKIVAYSFNFMLYSILSLSMFTADKWLVKYYFTKAILAEYILNFQYAFVVNIISIILGMYTLPIFCKLVNENKLVKLNKTIFENYIIAILASVFIAIISYYYAIFTGLHLTQGFWLLSLAFLFTNIFTVNVGVIESFKQIKMLFVLTLIPTIIFWLVVILFSWYHFIYSIYLSYIFYYVFLWMASVAALKRIKNNHCQLIGSYS